MGSGQHGKEYFHGICFLIDLKYIFYHHQCGREDILRQKNPQKRSMHKSQTTLRLVSSNPYAKMILRKICSLFSEQGDVRMRSCFHPLFRMRNAQLFILLKLRVNLLHSIRKIFKIPFFLVKYLPSIHITRLETLY